MIKSKNSVIKHLEQQLNGVLLYLQNSIALNPMNWFMIRDTRERLSNMDYSFPQRKIEKIDIHLDKYQKGLPFNHDEYIRDYSGKYEKVGKLLRIDGRTTKRIIVTYPILKIIV